MKELQVGDYVESGVGEFTKVYSFAHLNRDIKAMFLQIATNSTSSTGQLEISPDHLLVANGQYVGAGQLRVGDELIGAEGQTIVVEGISVIQRKGLFAPLTHSGDLMVNGVKVSNYVNIGNFSSVNDWHYTSHMVMSPIRLFCHLTPTCCKSETHDSFGYSTASKYIIRLAQFVGTSSPWVCKSLILVLYPFLVTMRSFEIVATYYAHPITTLMLAVVVSSMALGRKKFKSLSRCY